MSVDWTKWCRLCAKHETDNNSSSQVKTFDHLLLLVEKYDFIPQTHNTGTPKFICTECCSFVEQLDRFSDQCMKANKLFHILFEEKIDKQFSTQDLQVLRYKVGLDQEEKLIVGRVLKQDKSTDTDDLVIVEFLEQPNENSISDNEPKTRSRLRKSAKFKTEINEVEMSPVKDEMEIETLIYEEDNFADDPSYVMEDEPDHAFEEDDEDEDEDEEGDENDDNDEDFEDKRHISERQPSNKRSRKKVRADKKPYLCNECNVEFDRKRAYDSHMRANHPEASSPFVCSQCPKSFSSLLKVKRHETVHLPDSMKLIHPCPHCDKRFSKLVNVQTHICAIHTGDRPFICEECGKSFVAKGALKEHQITHSDECPFQCAHCPKKFKNMARLRTHEDIHKHTTYVCPHCGLQLNTKRTLKMHMVVHSDQKKYKCQYCGNEYKRSKALKNHLILHTGLRPYTCPFCEKTFANGSNCRSHKKKAHPVELAALEASGEKLPTANIPKLEHLQPKKPPNSDVNLLGQTNNVVYSHDSPVPASIPNTAIIKPNTPQF